MQRSGGLRIENIVSPVDTPLGSSNDLLRAAHLLFATDELPSQSDELSNNTTLPSFSDSVLAVDISAMSSNHIPDVSLAEGVHIGMRSATSLVRFSLSHRRVRLAFIAFKTSRTPSKRHSLHAVAFGTTCDFSLPRKVNLQELT